MFYMERYLNDDEVAEAEAEAYEVAEVWLGVDDDPEGLDDLLAMYEADTIAEHYGEA